MSDHSKAVAQVVEPDRRHPEDVSPWGMATVMALCHSLMGTTYYAPKPEKAAA